MKRGCVVISLEPSTAAARHALALWPLLATAVLFAFTCRCFGPSTGSRRVPADIPTEDLRGSPLYKVLERDAIPAIDEPRFVPAAAASFMKEDEPILGVRDGQAAKAYSLWLLDHHEIVNDTLGDRPIAATW